MTTIAFHPSHLTFRGTEVALYDYAHHNETILEGKSIIVMPSFSNSDYNNGEVLDKFLLRFPIFVYSNLSHLERICKRENVGCIYYIKYGNNDVPLPKIKSLIHCVYTMSQPHGHKYAGVSETIGDPFVPHMINIPKIESDMRRELNIPRGAVVFGRSGGKDTFDLSIAKEAILKVLREDENVYFIFIPRPYLLEGVDHPRIKYLEVEADLEKKRKFINTCDAMIDAQSLGNSFGLSVGEFSFCGKPIVTFNGGVFNGKVNQQHLKILGNKALKYNNVEELVYILKNFKRVKEQKEKDVGIKNEGEWNAYNEYSPDKVMKKFSSVFLDN